MASMVTALGFEGRGDFQMDPEGRLSRVPEMRVSPFAFPGVQIVHPRIFASAEGGTFSMNKLWDIAIEKGASTASASTACGCMSARPKR